VGAGKLAGCERVGGTSNVVAKGFWPVILIIAVVTVWVVAKVIFYMRRSEQQWQDVDKSKLKKWEDDED
jgi:hypothetical protein